MLDVSGNVLGRAAYTAWGANYGTTGLSGPVGYAGRFGAYTDADTGLILMGSRYYAPVLGRFISRDGAGYAGIRAHRGGPLGERMPTFVGEYPILARPSACNIRAHRLTCRHSAACPDSGRAWLAHMVGAACCRGP